MNNISFSHAAQQLLHSTDVTLFALVDGLQYERFYGEQSDFHPAIAMPLFTLYPDSRIAFAGPWLINMNQTMASRKTLMALESALPSVSWIVSPVSLQELVAHFQQHMNTLLPDGRVALLRFQDPRIQVRLGTLLDEQQHQELTALSQEWVTTIDGRIYSFKQREFLC